MDPGTIALVAAGVSALGNLFSAKSAAKAQAKANDMQLAMFHDSRGASGSAILPEYLKGYEGDLGADAAKTVQALYNYGGGAAGRLSNSRQMLSRYNPAIEAGDRTVIDLATGKLAADRRTSLAPVLTARTNLAKSRAAAINQSLDETLAGLRAQRAATGFRGGGTFDTARALDALTGARTAAAGELGQADFDNAQALHQLDDNSLQLMLSGLDMPFQRGQQRLAFDNLPATSLAQFYSAINAPLDFFRLPVGNPAAPSPVPSNGQINGAAVAGAGQAFSQYFAQQALMKQMADIYRGQGSMGGTPVYTWRNDPSYMPA